MIFNLHVEHTAPALAAAGDAFRALIDAGIAHGRQLLPDLSPLGAPRAGGALLPAMQEFLALKRQHDPDERF